ncbi:hypothetical protein P280DRAFT_467519 [Massarina eburnea CBS 473.64]|uniref:C2H2-type domain-containing protein n=1 Tax=Massarina eburnea CBS 473.64 TaxID=1395130 RepID=A0A6A6S8F8_9PLEO|nr:hypothetical protein P280DRAFT_467519 [Massarina eburnea CBS 473.64]
MALKRKEVDVQELPRKRSRRDIHVVASARRLTRGVKDEDEYASDFSVPESADDSNFDSDADSDEYAITHKEDGKKRADSEARRSWNYVCDFARCGQRFNRPCRLEAHMRSHMNIRPFVCHHTGCDKTFPRKDHLNRHLKNAHKESPDDFICDWPGCDKSFTSNGRLQRHKEVHDSKFYCKAYPPCNAIFRKEKTLEAHIQMEHLHEKPFHCPLVDPESGERCTLGYQTESSLRKHIACVHEKNQDPDHHYCMICVPEGTKFDTIQNNTGDFITIPKEPLVFKTQEELAAHTREVHKPTCAKCSQVFQSQANLKSHFQTVHADPASKTQFRCPRNGCDSVFTRRANLNVHIQHVHDKVYKFSCTVETIQDSKHADLSSWDGANACGDLFKAKSSLEQHIRTHHLGFQNRKAMRKAAKPRKKLASLGVLAHLTGAGYEEGRDIPCLVQACAYRFFNDGFLRRHLRSPIHNLLDAQIDEMILERNAAIGGQFWVGGLGPNDNESGSYLDSIDPSVPQTPMPYFADASMQMGDEYSAIKAPGSYGPFDPLLNRMLDDRDMQMFDYDSAEMDKMMGLDNLPPAVEAAEGLQWDMLVPVQRYNDYEMHE